MKKCNPCPEVGKSKSEITTKKVIKLKYDSTYKEAYLKLLDQLPEEKPLYSSKVPRRIEKLIDKENKKDPCGTVRRFVTEFKDSNDVVKIEGSITSLTKGQLLSTDIDFKSSILSVDTDMVVLDSTYEKETNYVVSNKLYLSLESAVQPTFMQFSGTVDFTTKRGWIFGYRYERNFDYNYNAHHAKVGYLISFRKNHAQKKKKKAKD